MESAVEHQSLPTYSTSESLMIQNNASTGEQGLYATTYFAKDEIVFTLRGNLSNTPTKFTIQIGEGEHIHDEWGRFMNHSFSPSCRVQNRNIVAFYDLLPNTELTFNYNESEVHMAAPFYVDSKLVFGNGKESITRTTSSTLTVEPTVTHDKESITPSTSCALSVVPTYAAILDNHVASPSFRPKDSLSSPSAYKRKAESLFEDLPSPSD